MGKYISKKDREIIKNKFGGKCAYTGKPLGNDWQVDHVIPQFYSYYTIITGCDVYKIGNLFPSCKIVNHYKRALDLEGFRRRMNNFHKRLSKLPKNTKIPSTQRRKEYMHKVAELFDITPDKPFSGKFYFETYNPKDIISCDPSTDKADYSSETTFKITDGKI